MRGFLESLFEKEDIWSYSIIWIVLVILDPTLVEVRVCSPSKSNQWIKEDPDFSCNGSFRKALRLRMKQRWVVLPTWWSKPTVHGGGPSCEKPLTVAIFSCLGK